MKKVINWFSTPPITGQSTSNYTIDGRISVFLGGHFEICLCNSRGWTIYQLAFRFRKRPHISLRQVKLSAAFF